MYTYIVSFIYIYIYVYIVIYIYNCVYIYAWIYAANIMWNVVGVMGIFVLRILSLSFESTTTLKPVNLPVGPSLCEGTYTSWMTFGCFPSNKSSINANPNTCLIISKAGIALQLSTIVYRVGLEANRLSSWVPRTSPADILLRNSWVTFYSSNWPSSWSNRMPVFQAMQGEPRLHIQGWAQINRWAALSTRERHAVKLSKVGVKCPSHGWPK